MTSRARVALIRTTPETVLQDYERLIELAEFRHYLDPLATTILKPDIRRHFPFPAANTPPWQLEGVARALRNAGYRDLACLEQKAAITSAFKGVDLNGHLPVLRAYSIAVCQTSPLARRQRVHYQPNRATLTLEERAAQAIRVRADLHGANIVLLATLKTDAATVIGGALWSAVGALSPTPWPVAQGRMRELLVDALTVHREIHGGMFAVMDGTTAGNGPGPYRLQPEVKNVLLASADPVALDAVAAKLMGFDPLRDVAYLRLAHERSLGVGDPRKIELVGDRALIGVSWRFSSGGRPWLGAFQPLQRFCVRGPLAHLLAFAAESYHDYYRWPFEERRVFESWLRGTQWGRLFARYQRPGKLRAVEPQMHAEGN